MNEHVCIACSNCFGEAERVMAHHICGTDRLLCVECAAFVRVKSFLSRSEVSRPPPPKNEAVTTASSGVRTAHGFALGRNG
jgi:hypothetical protein